MFKTFWGATLFHIDDLPFHGKKEIPDTYTQFRYSNSIEHVVYNVQKVREYALTL